MKAWVQTKYGGPDVLHIQEVPIPDPRPRDLRIKVLGAATNPVDGKKRDNFGNSAEELKGGPLILGYDGAGIVESIGSEVTTFKPGDEVWFAGVISRPGCNAEYTHIDERLVARKPKNLSFADAAAVPLCALTAWEGFVEGLSIPVPKDGEPNPNANKSVLIVAGAGGTGSIASQIAKRILKIGKVISTASRPDSIAYCKKHGADVTIDHTKDYATELQAIGLKGVDYIYNGIDAPKNFDQLTKVLNPIGKICFLTGGGKPGLNWAPLVQKRATVTFEYMFARGVHEVEMEKQHQILDAFAKYVEAGIIDPRADTKFPWSKMPEAHALQDSGKVVGKIVLEVKW